MGINLEIVLFIQYVTMGSSKDQLKTEIEALLLKTLNDVDAPIENSLNLLAESKSLGKCTEAREQSWSCSCLSSSRMYSQFKSNQIT